MYTSQDNKHQNVQSEKGDPPTSLQTPTPMELTSSLLQSRRERVCGRYYFLSRPTLWCDDSGKLLVRKINDIITRRTGSRRIDSRPAPLDKHPATLSDQCATGPSWRHSSRHRVYNLYLASVVVVGHLSCQTLFVVIHGRTAMLESCHEPVTSRHQMNTHHCIW